MQDIRTGDVKAAILSLLRARGGAARFVAELVAALARPGLDGGQTAPLGDAPINRVLSELESVGAIVVRDHYCADPHLDGVDLRIAALVPAAAEGADPQGEAIAAIEALWQRWLGDYLATHRCT